MIKRLFLSHPASVGESYREHMQTAFSFGLPLARATGAAFVHAFLPFLFTTTASRTVKQLNERMARRCTTCDLGPIHRPDLFALRQSALETCEAGGAI